MDEAKMQELWDRKEITDTSLRYATGVDMKDRALYRSCFTEEIEADFSSLGMGDASIIKADDWVEQAIMTVNLYQSTQHIITNHVIDIKGDEATCVAYLQAQHYNPEGMFTVGGYYSNTLVRTPEGWRISKLKLTSTWTKHS